VVRIAQLPDARWEPGAVRQALMAGDPAIHIDVFRGDLLVSTHCLLAGEELLIASALAELLSP
jgi:hypothetical protein